ncbi:activating signal cointegrator 1 complex subunit 1-like [Anneissia japonica]|uniref:activating signal cointegrator 1 complex subunit 1-like n=1 Tax=Anneissia japonica TaxID=1529436 RepID=UPI0014255FAF|nr:activating signal cointegrator 1 complex subunit 1-like [Anneissia japonica]XP_033112613.1 activating signal cointegrator 1 complex subunit 1-like [Anneissia japonica]
MDVLKPPIVNIGGRLYRKNPLSQTNQSWNEAEEDEVPYVEDDIACDDGPCGLDDIKHTEKGYEIKMDVPSGFYGLIIGKKGETKRRIETETNAKIFVPKGQQEEEITINSEARKNVIAARDRIALLVESARQRQPFTHFLSIPLVTPETKEAVQQFKSDVLSSCSESEGLDETMFQKPEHLHLTLGTLVLMNKHEVEKATILLHKCKTDIISAILQNQPLELSISGLEYMNDDPAQVDVLYCNVQPTDNSNKLQLLADSLVEQFVSEGLMQRQYDRVKIHGTLINSLFNKEPDGEKGNWDKGRGKGYRKEQKKRKSFNARSILEIFSDYNFSTCHLDEIHISVKGSNSENQFYRNEGFISLQ